MSFSAVKDSEYGWRWPLPRNQYGTVTYTFRMKRLTKFRDGKPGAARIAAAYGGAESTRAS